LPRDLDAASTIVLRVSSEYEVIGAELAAGASEFPWAADLVADLNAAIAKTAAVAVP
jgi:hypothetical protein